MPTFRAILALHSKISDASPATIYELANSFGLKTIQQILSTYVQFFFEHRNRKKYLDPDHPRSTIHTAFINASIAKLQSNKKPRKSQSEFDRFPTLLLSHCVSFLRQSDRARVSRVNLLCMNAASESIAKHHLRITPTIITREMFRPPDRFQRMNRFVAVGALQISLRCLTETWNYGLRARKQKKANYQHNMQWLLTTNHIRRFQGGAPKDLTDILAQHLPGTDVIVLDGDGWWSGSKEAMLSAKKVVVTWQSERESAVLRQLWSGSGRAVASRDDVIVNIDQ